MIARLLVVALMVGASQPSGSISGVIVDTEGHPVPGATLVLKAGDGGVSTTTDTNGRYLFARLSPGRYRIEVSMPGFEAKAGEVTVAPAGEETWGGALLVGPRFGAGSIEARVARMGEGTARDWGRHNAAAAESTVLR